MSARPERRSGFTLIELLVALSIILVLSVLAFLLVPSLLDREKGNRGADQVQGTLLIAKQRALRDQAPRGLHLVQPPLGGAQVRELQYVEQPADVVMRFSGGAVRRILVTDDPTQYVMGLPAWVTTLITRWRQAGLTNYSWVILQPTGAQQTGEDFGSGTIQEGDYIEVKGGGVRRIVHPNLDGSLFNILAPPAQTHSGIVHPLVLLLASPLPHSLNATADYKIIRSPRVLTGETPVQLPDDIAIDLSRSLNVPMDNNLPVIMFGPGGGVVGRGTGAGNIVLWVYDTSKDATQPGSQFLIAINVRTGLIAAHPVDESGPDPYSFTRDGRSSGL